MGLRLLGPLSLELSADGLLNPLQVETKAGAVSLWGAGAMGSLTVSWPLGEYVTLGGGVGAGFVQLAASASAARQFESRDDDTGIWLACARLRLGLRLGRLWTLRVQTDPTFFVPEVQIRADAASLVRLGRPWVPVSVGLAWTPGLP